MGIVDNTKSGNDKSEIIIKIDKDIPVYVSNVYYTKEENNESDK